MQKHRHLVLTSAQGDDVGRLTCQHRNQLHISIKFNCTYPGIPFNTCHTQTRRNDLTCTNNVQTPTTAPHAHPRYDDTPLQDHLSIPCACIRMHRASTDTYPTMLSCIWQDQPAVTGGLAQHRTNELSRIPAGSATRVRRATISRTSQASQKAAKAASQPWHTACS